MRVRYRWFSIENLEKLIDKCIGNSICVVEYFKIMLDQGYEPSADELKSVTSLLGEASKKTDVFKDKYIHVFLKNIDKNCVYTSDGDLCIYSWRMNIPIRYYPVSLDATGTILLFKENEVRVIAYPTCRTYDIEGHKVSIPDLSKHRVIEVSRRIDGYQITMYYNPLIKRWVPATRYVLHNMRWVKKRLEVDNVESIINPYASVANDIAEQKGLYDKLKGFEGWTFTFILEAPEPALVKPNVELYDASSFKLYLLNARKPDGTLLTIMESSKLINWVSVEVENVDINVGNFNEFIERWRKDLYIRSRFLRFDYGDKYRPFTLEVSSKLYPEAVNVKYYSDPKSIVILASEGYVEESYGLLVDYGELRKVGKEIVKLYKEIESLIVNNISNPAVDELIDELKLGSEIKGELVKARKTGSTDRFVKKLTLSLLTNDVFSSRDSLLKVREILVSKIRGRR